MRAPKHRNKTEAQTSVYCLGIRLGTTWPRNAERMDMMAKEENAAEKTTRRECFMAIMAAIRNVLSPISDTMIINKDIIKDFSIFIASSLLSNITEESILVARSASTN